METEAASRGRTAFRGVCVAALGLAAVWLVVRILVLGAGLARGETAEEAVMVPGGDHPVIEYRSGGAIFKPYVRKLFSPSGASVVRDQVPDHLHHHGLMFAVGIDGVDFWSETAGCGRQKHVAFDKPAPQAAGAGALAERIDWVGSSGDPVLAHERRTISVLAAKGRGPSLLTWRTEIEPPEGRASVKIAGSHYFGLGMRFPVSMDNEAEFFTAAGKADGEVVRGDERLTRGPWMACAGAVDGKPVTVAMFDAPGNPRPAWWFTMGKPFAYLSATLNLHREPLAVEAGKPLRLCYGVAVWDGKAKAEDIEKLYRQWLETAGGKPGKAP